MILLKFINKQENTFVYLLNTRAKIRRITDDYRKDINELMKVRNSVLINVITTPLLLLFCS